MTRFIGNIEAKTDEKGRVFLPATFRRVLQKSGDEKLMLRKDIHQRCLVLYPESTWNEQLDALRNRLNRCNRQEQMWFRQFVAGVDELTIDGNGRILIPKRYHEAIELKAEVRFIGMDDTIELWAKEVADSAFADESTFGAELEALMNDRILD